MRSVVAAIGFVVACGLACSPEPANFLSSSSSIALAGTSIWLTSPDNDQVVELDVDTLEVRRSFDVLAGPHHLLVAGDRVVATSALTRWLVSIDSTTGAVRNIETECGGTHTIVQTDHGSILVGCANDDRLLVLEEDRVVRTIAVEGPSALAVRDQEVFVGSSRHGRVQVFDAAWNVVRTFELESQPGFAASQVQTLSAGPGGVVGAYQRVDHDSDRDRPPERGGYGSVHEGEPRIEPRLFAECAGRYARFDGGRRVFAGPSAVAAAGGLLWVVHRETRRVAVLRCDEGTGQSTREAELLASYRVGAGGRGIALSPDGRTAWVDVGFEHAVARLEFRASDADQDAALELRRPIAWTRLSDRALRGRRIFFDADDTHLTPSGVVTCSTCHPAGGDDGRTWFLHTPGIERKLRRTPPAWGAGLAPQHWDGAFTDVEELSGSTIRELMEGDGLLVDLDALGAFMAETPPPPGAPRARAAAGRAVFEEAGCDTCHPGGRSDHGMHSTIPASADPDAQLDPVRTPVLFGVRARPPFFHDGRATDLAAVLTTPGPHDVSGRTLAERADLVEYLESL